MKTILYFTILLSIVAFGLSSVLSGNDNCIAINCLKMPNGSDFYGVLDSIQRHLSNLDSRLSALETSVPAINDRLDFVENFVTVEGGCETIAGTMFDHGNGYYYLDLGDGLGKQKYYCNMEAGGYTRVLTFNFTENVSTPCPGNFIPSSLEFPPYTGCAAAADQDVAVCPDFLSYSPPRAVAGVRGLAAAFQVGSTDGFFPPATNVNQFYLDGISVTYGQEGARTHLWSYAAAWSDDYEDKSYCPCSTIPTELLSFVGDHYYCESGNHGWGGNLVVENDVLWDGQDCRTTEVLCCDLSEEMPWFTRADVAVAAHTPITFRFCLSDTAENMIVTEMALEVLFEH